MLISNSEVETFQRCQRQHWFAYGLNLTPSMKFIPLKCGIMGHEVLEGYYRAKMAGLPQEECVQAGMQVVAEYMTLKGEEYDDGTVIPIVTKRFLQYAKHYKDEPWRILDVEGVYSIPMGNGIEYALTLDMLVEWTDGPYKGQQTVVDHKWCYNFWTLDEIHMSAQLPKYIFALRKLGSPSEFGIINQVRYREMKDHNPDSVFRRNRITPTEARMENIMDIQEKAAGIIRGRKMFRDLWDELGIPSISKMNCKNCFFKIPCSIELDGRSANNTLNSLYVPNTYGYSEEKMRRSLE